LVITWEPVDGYRLNGEGCPSSILRPPLSCFWRCALKTLYIPATQSARAQMHSPTAAVRGTFEGHEHVSIPPPRSRTTPPARPKTRYPLRDSTFPWTCHDCRGGRRRNISEATLLARLGRS